MAVNASLKRSFVVLSIRRSLRRSRQSSPRDPCAACQEGVPRFEIVELIDRHHVHGAHALDFRRAGPRPSRPASSPARRRNRRGAASTAGAGFLLDLRGIGRVVNRLGAGEQPCRARAPQPPRPPRRARPARTRRTTTPGAPGRLRRSRASRRAGRLGAHALEVRRASRMRPSSSSKPARSDLRSLVGRSHAVAQLVERRATRRPASIRRPRSIRAARSAAIPCAADRRCASGHSRFELAQRILRGAALRFRARSNARPGRRATPWLRTCARLCLHRLARLEQAALCRVQQVVAVRCSDSIRAMDSRASSCRASWARSSSSADGARSRSAPASG